MPRAPALPAVEQLFEQAACGLLVTGTDGTILRANETFCRWIGRTADELTGRQRLQDLLTMGGRVFHQTHWSPLLQIQGSVAEMKLEFVHREGHAVPMLLNVIRRTHPGHLPEDTRALDEVSAMVVSDRHKYERELLLERKKVEVALAERLEAQHELRRVNERLSDADRRKDEFLATLAHELRNPLAPMRNVLAILDRKASDDPQVLWCRGVLQRQLAHMTHLVDDLLEVSRITQGKLELRIEPTDLRTVVDSAVESSRPWIDASSHRLELRECDGPTWLQADRVRLTQVLVNLLNNAAKYTPAGGVIRLECEREGNEAVIRIIDSGIGIAANQLATVFEMFSQLEPALERAHGGLGIGLALVRGLVKLHGGSITAHSDGPGTGSTFTVRLPLAPRT